MVKLWKHSPSTKVTRVRIRPHHHEWVDKLGSSHRSGRFFLPILRFSLSSKTKTWLDLILFVVNTCTHLTRRHIGSDCYASLLTDEITSWTIYVDKYTTIFRRTTIMSTRHYQLKRYETRRNYSCTRSNWKLMQLASREFEPDKISEINVTIEDYRKEIISFLFFVSKLAN